MALVLYVISYTPKNTPLNYSKRNDPWKKRDVLVFSSPPEFTSHPEHWTSDALAPESVDRKRRARQRRELLAWHAEKDAQKKKTPREVDVVEKMGS